MPRKQKGQKGRGHTSSLGSQATTMMKALGHFDTDSPIANCDHGKQEALDNANVDLVELSGKYYANRFKYMEMGAPDGMANMTFLRENKQDIDANYAKFVLCDAANQMLKGQNSEARCSARIHMNLVPWLNAGKPDLSPTAGFQMPDWVLEVSTLVKTIESPEEVNRYIRKHLSCNCLGGSFKKEIKKTSDKEKCLQCFHCRKKGTSKDFMRCSRCKLTTYCDRDCQVKHWPDHKIECKVAQGKKLTPEEAQKHADIIAKRDWTHPDPELTDEDLETFAAVALENGILPGQFKK